MLLSIDDYLSVWYVFFFHSKQKKVCQYFNALYKYQNSQGLNFIKLVTRSTQNLHFSPNPPAAYLGPVEEVHVVLLVLVGQVGVLWPVENSYLHLHVQYCTVQCASVLRVLVIICHTSAIVSAVFTPVPLLWITITDFKL